MIEIPEAETLAKQINDTVAGKTISRVIAGLSLHKFAWYFGDPAEYEPRLRGKTIDSAAARGGMLEISAGDAILLFTDGVALRYHTRNEQRPRKHQLLVSFGDDTALSASVQMYGGLWCFREGEFENQYYEIARAKPSPLTGEFSANYYDSLYASSDTGKLSAKAFLATGQRIPGLGNGVLQDILYNTGIHPKRKVETFSEDEKSLLFHSVKSTLKEMTEQGGRDTTKDLFGNPGGYVTRLSQSTAGKPCPKCGSMITKQAYMGGSIYFCEGCQKLP